MGMETSKRDKHLGMMIDQETHFTKYEGRTGNGQVLFWIRRGILEFEKLYGEIPYPSE